jgi:hypothetical protein
MGEWMYSSTILNHELDGSSHLHALAALPMGKLPPPPATHRVGDWVCLRAGLDAVEKILVPAGNRTPSIQHVAGHYADIITVTAPR